MTLMICDFLSWRALLIELQGLMRLKPSVREGMIMQSFFSDRLVPVCHVCISSYTYSPLFNTVCVILFPTPRLPRVDAHLTIGPIPLYKRLSGGQGYESRLPRFPANGRVGSRSFSPDNAKTTHLRE